MKKICLVLLLMLPVVANAQRSTTTTPKSATAQKVNNTQKEPEKNTKKYEDIVSKAGVVFTTYSYPMGKIVLKRSTSSFTYELSFSIDRVVIDNASVSFLQVSHRGYDDFSYAMIEESNVKEWCNSLLKIKEICKVPVPDGAEAQYSYINNDGVVVMYENDVWKIQLEKFTKDIIWASDIDPLITKLQEIIQKFEAIK